MNYFLLFLQNQKPQIFTNVPSYTDDLKKFQHSLTKTQVLKKIEANVVVLLVCVTGLVTTGTVQWRQ